MLHGTHPRPDPNHTYTHYTVTKPAKRIFSFPVFPSSIATTTRVLHVLIPLIHNCNINILSQMESSKHLKTTTATKVKTKRILSRHIFAFHLLIRVTKFPFLFDIFLHYFSPDSGGPGNSSDKQRFTFIPVSFIWMKSTLI